MNKRESNLRIFYDNIIFSLQRIGGISIYWTELIKRLIAKNNSFFFESKNDNVIRKTINIVPLPESLLSVIVLRYLPFTKRLPAKSLFHSSYYRVSLQKNVVNITTVHDFTYEYFMRGIAQKMHKWQKKIAVNKSDGIICISENTKKDLIKFYPNIDPSKIEVIYNGVNDVFKKLENPKMHLQENLEILKNKKYILYVGDRSSYKNFDVVIEVIRKSREYHLVVVGGNIFSSKEKIKEVEDRIFHFTDVKTNVLNVLYNNAFCLLYPSDYEGFGLPVVEAMKTGCPVIAKDASSIPEISGGAALLVKESTAENCLNEMKKLNVKELRDKLVIKGIESSKRFSWDNCFEQTYNFYQKIWIKKFN